MPVPSEKRRATCPHCSAGFTVPGDAEGKSAKCPKCGKTFAITFQQPTPDSSATAVTSPTPAQVATRAPASTASSRRISLPLWAIVAGPAVACLIVGYVAGREHLKYQMRSAVADAGKAFAEGLRNAFPGMPDQSVEPEQKPDPPPRLALGDTYDAGGFTVQVLEAVLRRPAVKEITGGVSSSKEPLLTIQVRFTNKDDRKVLTFREDRLRGGSVFRLRDDVDNVVRAVNFGLGNQVVGAMGRLAELRPEESLEQLQVFSVPLPKTKSLVLNVDLYCFEGEGEVEFEIPIASVRSEGD